MSVVIENVDSLRTQIAQGQQFKYLLFWGHQARGDTVDKSCLSQWYPAAFQLEGDRYLTAEHYMMVAKARLFGDHATAQKVLQAPHPNAAKKLGREVQGFDETVWQQHRQDIVFNANLAKFSQHPELQQFLCNTGQKVLVEASPVDNIWGIGLAASDPAAQDPLQWQGLNLLGFALMRVRAHLLGYCH